MKRPIPIYRGGSIAALKTFELFNGLSGVDNLDPNLTINGTTVEPTFVYYGGDATGTTWAPRTYGETLTLQAGTAPTYNNGSPLLGANDDSVRFNDGGYYAASGNSFADITTEDIVIETIFKTPVGTSREYPFAKRIGSGTYNGWALRCETNGTLILELDDGADSVLLTTSAIPFSTWHHVAFCVNRDDATHGGRGYINGDEEAIINDMTSVAGSLTCAAPFTFGYKGYGSVEEFDSNIAYLAMWKRSSWHQAGAAGPAEWAPIFAERFAKLCGYYPQKANGTAMPTTATRAFDAYLTKYESGVNKQYRVGGEWLRQDYIQDSSANDVKGYRGEIQSENEFLYSEDLSNAAWVKTRCTINSNGATAPNGEATADGIIGTAVSNTHFVGQAMASDTSEHEWSVWLKKENKTWAYVNVPTVANANVYIDVDTPAVGTKGAGMTAAYVRDDGDDWVKCTFVYTGGAPSHSHDIYPADSDGDHTYTGDGSTVDLWVWGQQHEHSGAGYSTSYIKTTSAERTRLKDQLRYVAGDNIGGEDNGRGTVVCDFLLQNFDLGNPGIITQISDGGSAADRFNLYVANPLDRLFATTRASGGDNGDVSFASDVVNGQKLEARLTWEVNDVNIYLDGVAGTQDTSAGMPDNVDRIDFAQSVSSDTQFNGLISNFRIYKKPVKSG